MFFVNLLVYSALGVKFGEPSSKRLTILQKAIFNCSKHAVINTLTDLLHKERFYIRDINDRKGFIYAQRGLRFFSLGRTCIIRIVENDDNVEVEVRCSNKLGFGIPGITSSIERKILHRLQEEL